MLKILSFIANIIIVICEVQTLGHIRKKRDILKFYTYLQNLLALIASFAFSVCLPVCWINGGEIPEFVKGLRYVATSGLVATMFIFLVFLGNGKKISITEEDFLNQFNPKTANVLLHYVCPILSVVSLLLLEREIPLSNSIWTGLAAVPSCVYWIVYIILSVAKLWEEPYDFSSKESKWMDKISFVIIPLSFIAITFVLWNVM